MKPFIYILFFFLSTSNTVHAQDKIRYSNFEVHVIDGIVRIDFTLLGGSTCNGIQIYRSADSNNMVQIGEISGSCGSPANPVPYFYIDYNPLLNARIYYKVEFGGLGYSELQWIEIIDLGSGKVQIRPHPANQETTFYFENLKNETRILRIYNLYGQELFRFETNEKQIHADTNNFDAGIYLYTVEDASGLVLAKDKLIIQH